MMSMKTGSHTILSPKELIQMWTMLAQDDTTPDAFELTEHGEIVMSPKPTNRHQVLCAKIILQLSAQLGPQAVPDAAILTNDAGIRVPDVVWMPEEKWDVVMTADGLLHAPDLVVEVLSPGNRETEINHKTQAYLASGVQEVIIVGLTGTIEYIREDGMHPTSIFNLTLSLPSPLFS
ncbi:MAG: Uma2 family endonuclease [Nitrospirota bacterium]|nr:Uma2 family endonuclease [Nitrospirota bacterium]